MIFQKIPKLKLSKEDKQTLREYALIKGVKCFAFLPTIVKDINDTPIRIWLQSYWTHTPADYNEDEHSIVVWSNSPEDFFPTRHKHLTDEIDHIEIRITDKSYHKTIVKLRGQEAVNLINNLENELRKRYI
ncbi:hypothetical protein EAH77_15475 [Ewingella americana]|uniref:Uncharacterized protein n=1 Tax=Ewingella americana TaxID=41202 RepID=A0A502GDG9_9GAMM|nr:hypothetical protein EAH77_15475 [Ewingella americana]